MIYSMKKIGKNFLICNCIHKDGRRMKTFFKVCIIFLCLSSIVYSQYSRGKVLEGKIIESKILGEEVRYTVYLPFDYDTSERYYPVVYLLHGFGDNDMGWIQFGEANILCDKAIAESEIPPMILVMPDARRSWYINNYNGSVKYEDFFIQEFIPFIETEYRIRNEKRYRGVAGLSMGGYGALIYSLKYPDMFAACAAFSAGISTRERIIEMELEQWNIVYGPVYGENLAGNERLTEHLLNNDVLEIVKNIDTGKMNFPRLYIDCGDDDFLIEGNMQLHSLLLEKEIDHEFRVRDGRHQWSYWRSGLIDGLKYIGTSFHQP